MFESYLLTTDGKEYIDANSVREALGIVDEHVDILGVIKKLKEERDGLKADLDLTNRLYKEHHDFVDKVCEAVDIQRPYIESEYDNAVKLIAGFKRERDELKEKCDKMKKRANAAYGASCGYSSDKAPAFLCNVISYRWSFGAPVPCSLMDEPSYPIRNDSICVELELTPTANYKGTFDLEDLKRYIQNYGREKKLSDFEVFCKLVNNCIDELCDKYTVVKPDRNRTTRERLDYIFTVLGDYRGMHDSEWNRVEKLIKEKRAVEDSLAELRAKIREIYRSVVDDEWDMSLSYTSALNDINEEYKRVVHNFEERTADWSKAQKELDRYKLAVGSLLDIPKETRDDINAIERSFTFSKKKYESLKKFRDDVCEIFDIPSSMADKYVLKEIHDFADRYDELEDFRADICGALDIEGMLGTPQQNDKYILEQVEKLKKTPNQDAFRYAICNALNMPTTVIDGNIIGRIHLMQDRCDKLARLRSNICTALCLGGETDDEDILKTVRRTKECHDALCDDCADLGKDYTELRKAIWEAMDRKPDTLPEEDARLVGEVRMLQMNYVPLKRLHDEVAKAIGMDRPATDNVILNNVQYIYKDRADAYGMVSKLNDRVTELEKAKDDLQQKFDFQSGLRKTWHARYESEHERANCVQKALDREREKSRVKDISLETAKKQYEKVFSNLETAECAINGMKSKVRSLREEKTKVISALGQDIWDDCLKEEENNE